MVQTDNQYKTTDTALASYLVVSGFVLQSIDYSQPRYAFSFIMSPEIKEHAGKYLIGTALTDPAVFNKINKKLLRILRNQIQWEDD